MLAVRDFSRLLSLSVQLSIPGKGCSSTLDILRAQAKRFSHLIHAGPQRESFLLTGLINMDAINREGPEIILCKYQHYI
jgi:hypothetical protein